VVLTLLLSRERANLELLFGYTGPVLPELARDKDLFLMARDSSSVVLTTLEEQTYSADALGSYRGSVGNAHWAFTSAALFSGLIADAQKR
jgi:hypothetical protein